MCLVTKEKDPTKSSYNIECYKVLTVQMLSPYRDYKYTMGEVIEDEEEESVIPIFDVYMIDKGYLHSYKTLDAAKKLVDRFKRICKCKIYKAEIPAGTLFYEGAFNEFCSKALKLIEECIVQKSMKILYQI